MGARCSGPTAMTYFYTVEDLWRRTLKDADFQRRHEGLLEETGVIP